MQSGPAIELRGVYKRFPTASGGAYTALRDLSFQVGPGEFCAVVGPTGCGKSTTLGLIAGLDAPSIGEVRVFNQPVKGLVEGVGYMFQSDAVFPWRDALSNVMAGPRFRGVSKAEAAERGRDWLRRVGLEGFERYYPHQMSGGMRKRLALAQTFINHPRILLMDEPFSALDAQTRSMMQEVLLDIWGKIPTTTVFVTHDIDEALFLADRIVVMSARPGRVIEDVVLPFARPRSHELVTEPEFVRLKRHVMQLLRRPEGSEPLARLSPLGATS
jgi:NitT/TauT family transport system ATP-binding protein